MKSAATLMFWLALAGPVLAQEAPRDDAAARPQAEATQPALGAATREWLELQRSGRAAGSQHGIPGEIASLNWRRYVDSYKTPIPASLGSSADSAAKTH